MTTTEISELYVSIFNRASEKSGNDYWAGLNLTAAEIADAMLATSDAQAYFGAIPVYKLESAIGPDHEKEFELSLWINDKHYATAKGKSKKLAQQASAKIVLDKLRGQK